MFRILFALSIFFVGQVCYAELPSVSYVQEAVETKVDTSATANQTMAGTYNVTVVMTVPTPPLPPMP